MIEAFFLTWLGVLAAQASPGPNLVAVASVALAEGRRSALYVVTGVASGMLVWSLATAMGLGALLTAFPLSMLLMKLIGGGYLLFLGLKAARATWRGQAATIRPDHARLSDIAAWRRGLLVVLTNPKAALMWAAVATFLFGLGLSPVQVLAFGPIGALSGLAVYGTYALLFSTGLAVQGYARFARWVEGAFAAIFGAMGTSLIWSGLREARG
ncbi:LysE family translocator [Jannaschia aquimarina]|uniref:RhtC_5 protein n=1 Tax=Jannaschia aquimarina TaxID=935700 RepID=A0A0D1CKM3_9RHOB|nr:LysE family transporter [Jannaschia aquimarina]KIT15307.1 Threonine efflux protein [Jannaschia aquimarina]SNS50896.1 Threonine/homoserine/homoserine lactone efflux protein [Jannaschia aquimarina]